MIVFCVEALFRGNRVAVWVILLRNSDIKQKQKPKPTYASLGFNGL
jgi:hypothetical protein